MKRLLALAAVALPAVGVLAEDAAPRKWTWHQGTDWKPNGLDAVYRIESRFNGLALTAPPGQTGDPAFVQQFHTAPHHRQRFRMEAAGDGCWYIRDTREDPVYLEHPDPGRRRTTVITLAEVQAFGPRGGTGAETLVSQAAQASQSSQYGAYPAANALDGNLENFTHTAGGPEDWWEMDLKEACTLTRLVVHNRPWYETPLAGCTVRAFDGDRKPVWSALLKTAKRTYAFPLDSVKVRYVRIGLEPDADPGARDNVLGVTAKGFVRPPNYSPMSTYSSIYGTPPRSKQIRTFLLTSSCLLHDTPPYEPDRGRGVC